MIQVLNFRNGLVSDITKDTPNLEKHGAYLREVAPVKLANGLALQKCQARLYALIHVGSGHTLQQRSMNAKQAEEWFDTASTIMDWNCPVEALVDDSRVKEAFKSGMMLEDAYMFPPEREALERAK
jgi:hypothetical protein